MQYRQLVKRVQDYSGFSDSESETALRLFVRKLAARLTQDERKDFASQLPSDLQDMALTTETSDVKTQEDFIRQFCEEENIEEGRAKKQVMAAWKAIKDALTPGQIKHIKTQLPDALAESLY
jgi:uncharacterized protein (DUF2267 family)